MGIKRKIQELAIDAETAGKKAVLRNAPGLAEKSVKGRLEKTVVRNFPGIAEMKIEHDARQKKKKLK